MAVSLDKQTCQKLQFSYGIYPQYISTNPLSWPHYAQEWLADCDIAKSIVLVIEGGGTLKSGDTTRLDILDLS